MILKQKHVNKNGDTVLDVTVFMPLAKLENVHKNENGDTEFDCSIPFGFLFPIVNEK